MAEGPRPALGLSIGATNLAAVTADHAITRKPVLTLYRQRPPEVGLPSENPRLDQPGLVMSDFVDRVGDPVGIVAADGSMHRSEALLVDSLRALAYTATGGRALPDHVALTYPAHWGSAAVDALGAALSRVPEWSHETQPLLIPDAAAALFAMRANPGIPARGIVAVCDFGGSGTSITLVDAAGDYQPVAETVRHRDFSGDLIDRALLTYVMSEMPATGSFDPSGTAAIGSLNRLRIECRNAKERLSHSTVTTLADELPGMHREIRLTRNEFDETIREALDGVAAVMEQTLARNGIHPADLVAIVSVGGGANIASVTTTLSGRFGVPVVTAPRPQLTAAIGAALRAARGPADTSATVLTSAPAVAATALVPPAPLAPDGADTPASALQPALAWSEADDDSRVLPVSDGDYADAGGSGYTSARPQLAFDHDTPAESKPEPPVIPWYRLPAVIIVSTVVAVLLVGTAVAIALGSNDKPATRSPGVSPTPTTSAPAPPPPTEGSPEPAPSPPGTEQPAPQAPPAPPPSTEAHPPTTQTTPPPTTTPPRASTTPTTTAAPTTTQPPATTQPLATTQPPATTQAPPTQQAPAVPQIPPIPAIPQIPGISFPQIPQVPGL
ncbi:Hsp70 family protein [Mycobacterium ostraviense]|uniref:Hsp70 family protein n=1 Tax=Mycobacterium ostraviense TaxID=2738409 RepID=UPI000C07FF87|nr:Hsp70 family protein [Mycobacterium ostraviense]UGT93177.1 Hsp70 family protein [Mycobacterium ostraviense]